MCTPPGSHLAGVCDKRIGTQQCTWAHVICDLSGSLEALPEFGSARAARVHAVAEVPAPRPGRVCGRRNTGELCTGAMRVPTPAWLRCWPTCTCSLSFWSSGRRRLRRRCRLE